MIKVSIIVPVYNTEKYLPQCLDSLLQQTLDDIEIIIINDWSTDWSQAIIDFYLKKYPSKIVSITKDNWWQSEARNLWLSVAKWEYIWFVDSDDWVELNMFAKLYSLADSNRYDVVSCWYKKILNNNTKNFLPYQLSNDFFDSWKDFITTFTFQAYPCNKLFKNTLLQDNFIRFISWKWFEDIFFIWDVGVFVRSYAMTKDILYNYRIHYSSTTQSFSRVKSLERLEWYIHNFKKYRDTKLYEKVFLCLYWVFVDSCRWSYSNEFYTLIDEPRRIIRNFKWCFWIPRSKWNVIKSFLNLCVYYRPLWLFFRPLIKVIHRLMNKKNIIHIRSWV